MAATDNFGGVSKVTDPAGMFTPVTPNDSVDLSDVTRMVTLAVGGTLKATRRDGTAVTVTLPAGAFPMMATRIWATGTTATGITAFW